MDIEKLPRRCKIFLNCLYDLIYCRNYSVLLRNPQFLHKVEKWKRAEKNQRNVNIQEAKKVVC